MLSLSTIQIYDLKFIKKQNTTLENTSTTAIIIDNTASDNKL